MNRSTTIDYTSLDIPPIYSGAVLQLIWLYSQFPLYKGFANDNPLNVGDCELNLYNDKINSSIFHDIVYHLILGIRIDYISDSVKYQDPFYNSDIAVSALHFVFILFNFFNLKKPPVKLTSSESRRKFLLDSLITHPPISKCYRVKILFNIFHR